MREKMLNGHGGAGCKERKTKVEVHGLCCAGPTKDGEMKFRTETDPEK